MNPTNRLVSVQRNQPYIGCSSLHSKNKHHLYQIKQRSTSVNNILVIKKKSQISATILSCGTILITNNRNIKTFCETRGYYSDAILTE